MADEEIIFKDPNNYVIDAFQDAPYRLQSGKAGALFTYIPARITDVLQQMLQDFITLKFHKLGPKYSPNDYITVLGREFGIIPFPGETTSAFRDRLTTKWDYVRTYGQEDKLKTVLENVLTGSFTVTIDRNVTGTDTPVARPKNAGIDIQPYGPVTENKFQFNVVIEFPSGSIGTGEYSNFVTDTQFAAIRDNIKLIKAVNWACREIIFYYNPDNYYLWNGEINYDSAEASTPGYRTDSASTFVMERHSYQQRIR